MKFSRVLSKGMHGSDIKWVQEQLVRMNLYDITPNGFFNQETTDAIKKLQTKLGQNTNGVINVILWNNIQKNSVNIKKKTIDIASVSVSNGVQIYDRIQNLNNDNVLSNKKIINVGFSNGSGNAELSCDVIKNVSYFIGYDGIIFRALDDIKNDSEFINIRLCNWGEVILNKDNKFINCVGIEISDIEEYKGRYYQKVSTIQKNSLKGLLIYLQDRYDIDVEYSADYIKVS